MNNLTKEEFTKIYKDGKNLTDKPIFIDFYADWWGPCKMFEQVLNEVTPDYKNKMSMYKVDIGKETDLAIMFEARSIPYMAFISEGGEISAQAGSLDKNTLKYYLEGLISKK